MKNLNPLYIKIGIGLLIIISILFNFKQCNDKNIDNVNITALTDTLKITKNKLGEEVASKKILLMDKAQLKSTNSELTAEINKLSSSDKRNLIEISKLNIIIDMLKDSVSVLKQDGTIVVINDSTKMYPYPFNKSDKFREFTGVIKVTSTSKPKDVIQLITSDKIFADLVIGKKEVKDGIEIFATSSNPSMHITNIVGSVIDLKAYNKYQKSKPFGLGIHIGYGFNLNQGVVRVGPTVSVGLNYNFLNF